MSDDNVENKVIQIKLDDIIPNRFQPREIFDENGLEELAKSIKEHGVIQPIIVRKLGDKYELIAGERRTKASALAGKTTIPAIVREMDDRESAKVSLLENLQRKNLSAIEEAKTYKRILELENMTQEELARTMGRSQPMVANKLRLLSLPEEIQEALMKNQISERHARSLLTIQDKKEQLEFLERIKNERLTVRELDSEIKKYKEQTENKKSISDSEEIKDKERFMNNNRSNFGGMGLNDYQSGVGSMFNNIPINFNNMANQNIGGMENTNINNMDSFSNQNVLSNDNSTGNGINGSSLGLMLDGVPTNDMMTSTADDNVNDNNLFISQIRDNNVSSQQNQFLPNFDDNSLNTTNNNFNNNLSINDNFNNSMPNNNTFGGFDSTMNNMNMYQQTNSNPPMYTDNSFENSNLQTDNMMSMNNLNSMENTPYQQTNMNNDMPINYSEPINDTSLPNQPQDQMGNYDFYGNPVSNPNDAYQPTYNNNTNNNPTNNDFAMNSIDQYNNFDVPSNNNIPDFGTPSYGYDINPNNGGLFNQPLNIVGDYGQPLPGEKPIQQNNFNNGMFMETPNNIPMEPPMEEKKEESILNQPGPLEPSVDTNIPETPATDNNAPKPEDFMNTKIPDIEVIGDNEIQQSKEMPLPEEPKKEYIKLEEEITIHNINDAIMELKKVTDKIKQNHINIESEEIDYDDVYQITIKLKKEDI